MAETRRVVYRYTAGIGNHSTPITVPWPARIVHVGQHETTPRLINVWIEHPKIDDDGTDDPTPPDYPTTLFLITVRGTGHPIDPEDGEHVGTVIEHRPWLVWHVYVTKEEK